MISACGASNALAHVGSLTGGFVLQYVPVMRYASFNTTKVSGAMTAPVITPTISAICCFHGVAPTKCPVFRSCITSPAIAALTATTLAMINVANISSFCSIPRITSPTTQTNNAVPINVAIVIPDTGELLDPTTPAIYPATAEKKKAVTARNSEPNPANITDSISVAPCWFNLHV